MDITLDRLFLRIGGFELRANCRLESNRAFALIGPSGEGKTTLLQAIAGFLSPVSGRIEFGGRDFTNIRPSERPTTILFQEHNLFPHVSVYNNAALGVRTDLRLSKVQRHHVISVLDRVGLSGLRDRMPGELSGGQRQRVALARALLRSQPVLLLDEPFAALGPGLRKEMLDLVAEIRAEYIITLVMVTHEPADALRIADYTLLICKGRVSPPSDTQEFFAHPSVELKSYLGL
ncbi:MAG: ATP-binding cassette domain-containing protein [Albidovulum sp.]|nr:ATP-binding cassette domain-containing protein [Albidovulum sp.]MDE0304470.1 ATP-binding cassette domain-containing protein [Albidovulum sp.]MDE0533390.1 ATP-binding cassette domain-containing protein [Albidovulum sp.]